MPKFRLKQMRACARQAAVLSGLCMIGSASLGAQQLVDVPASEISSASTSTSSSLSSSTTTSTSLTVADMSSTSLATSVPANGAANDLPDAVEFIGQAAQQPAPPAKVDPDGGPQQTKRIAGIMPNFRSVSRDTILPPQSARDKLVIAGHDTFDYSAFIIVGIQATIAFSDKSYPEFHQGVMGYTRYYWHTLADTIDENFMVGGLGPVLFHTDSRFYTLGHGGVRKRLTYAVSRVAITRKDDGRPTFNFAEVIGAGAAAGLSSTYYPTVYRDWTKVGQKWLTSMIIDSANFVLKEYWPDINHVAFHRKKHNAAAQDTP